MPRFSHPIVPRAAVALLAVVLAALPLLGAQPARADVTFTVNLPGDAADLNAGDGKCDASLGAGLQCTLRAAIQQANATADPDTIRFNIPGGGVKTIRPNAELPKISQPVTIDGYTQPSAKPNTATVGTNADLRIELDGTNAGAVATGLRIESRNTLVRGLVVNRFEVGIAISGTAAAGSQIAGCFIGTDPSGTVARPTNTGVDVDDSSAVVGGTAPAARNLIAGNTGSGVILFRGDAGSRVEGNLIGTARDGVSPLGNGGSGVFIQAGSNNVVGGATPAHANTVAFNDSDGVIVINSGTGNRVLRNRIFANAGLGIDLLNTNNEDGPNPNDPGDGDAGVNNFQNTPVITLARRIGSSSLISGELNSAPNAAFTVRFFVNPDGGEEGKVFLGQQTVTTDASGNANLSLNPTRQLQFGETVTATATSAGGDTSEFSPPATVV